MGGIALQLHRPHSLLHSTGWTRKEVRCNAVPASFFSPLHSVKEAHHSNDPSLSPLLQLYPGGFNCGSVSVFTVTQRGRNASYVYCRCGQSIRVSSEVKSWSNIQAGLWSNSQAGLWSNRSSWVMELSTSWVVEQWSGKVGSWIKRGATTHAWRARILTHGHNYSDYMPFFLCTTPLVNSISWRPLEVATFVSRWKETRSQFRRFARSLKLGISIEDLQDSQNMGIG